jgi:hypothetical protein
LQLLTVCSGWQYFAIVVRLTPADSNTVLMAYYQSFRLFGFVLFALMKHEQSRSQIRSRAGVFRSYMRYLDSAEAAADSIEVAAEFSLSLPAQARRSD